MSPVTPKPPGKKALPLAFTKQFRERTVLAGRYQLLREIGSGGAATVWDARDMKTTQRVAVKVLHQHLHDNSDASKRFFDEADVASRARHPALVAVLDRGVSNSTPFIVMELIRGPSLLAWVKSRGPLGEADALRMFTEVAEALAAVHAEDIIHRDVKPANLLVTRDEGGSYRLKVTDFGYARVGGRSMTAPGFCVGTTAYMAPEQVLSEDIDGRIDVFALGVSLFFALTGELPFDSAERARVLGHQLHSKAPPASWLRPELSAATDRVIAKAMRKNKTLRFEDMSAMARAMRAAGTPRSAKHKSTVFGSDHYEPESDEAREIARLLEEHL